LFGGNSIGKYGKFIALAGIGTAAGWIGWKIGKTIRLLASINIPQSIATPPHYPTDDPLTVLVEKETAETIHNWLSALELE
jgi:hypothetical protein